MFLKLLLIIALTLTSCANQDETYTKDYNSDLRFDIPNENNFLVIKEWSLLLAGGAEIYYEKSDGEQIFLGDTYGTDDGYQPFRMNDYTITFENDGVTISYDFGSNDVWKTNHFDFP